MVKNLPASIGDVGLIAGWGRSPGGGNGNPLQCSYLGNPMDNGTWLAKAHEAAKSWTQLNDKPFKKSTRPNRHLSNTLPNNK